MRNRLQIGKAYIEYYEKDSTSERIIEIGLGLYFRNLLLNNTKDFLEVGAVLPSHMKVEHDVIDLFDPYEKCIREDATNYDYTERNVLAISTIEHIGRDDYKKDGFNQILKPENASTCLEKIIKEANKYLITIPIGYNTYLDNYIANMNTTAIWLARDEKNNWFEYPAGHAVKLSYGKPFDFANGLIILTNIDEFFSKSKLNIEELIAHKPETGRNNSFKVALTALYNNYGFHPVNIVETGTIRNLAESARMSDGWGTVNWQYWAGETGSKVWTCDIDPEAIENCKTITKNDKHITYVVDDSVNFLQNFKEQIHLLYLDSFDTGTPEQIIGACNHQLKEVQAAMDKLGPSALILLDDIHGNFPDFRGGKGELSIKYLTNNGWKIINYDREAKQVLLERM